MAIPSKKPKPQPIDSCFLYNESDPRVAGYQHHGGHYAVSDWKPVDNVMARNPNLGVVAVRFPSKHKGDPKIIKFGTGCVFGKNRDWIITAGHVLIDDVDGSYPEDLSFCSANMDRRQKSQSPAHRNTEKMDRRAEDLPIDCIFHGNGFVVVPDEFREHRHPQHDIGIFRLKRPCGVASKEVVFANLSMRRPDQISVCGYLKSERLKGRHHEVQPHGGDGELLVPIDRRWNSEWEYGCITVRAWKGMSGAPMVFKDHRLSHGDHRPLIVGGLLHGVMLRNQDKFWWNGEYYVTLICDAIIRFLKIHCGKDVVYGFCGVGAKNKKKKMRWKRLIRRITKKCL